MTNREALEVVKSMKIFLGGRMNGKSQLASTYNEAFIRIIAMAEKAEEVREYCEKSLVHCDELVGMSNIRCGRCRKPIRHNELFYGYDRNHYIGDPADNTVQDWFRFALCKKCDSLLWEFVTGEKERSNEHGS